MAQHLHRLAVRACTARVACRGCRSLAFSSSAVRARPEALPFTEKVRRKIWGTDQPPGQADPYGSQSKFERRGRARQSEGEEAVGLESQEHLDPVVKASPEASYEPALNWKGLESVGGDVEESGPQYEGFMTQARLASPQERTAALHRAVVEVFTLKEAGRELSEVSDIPPTEDLTEHVHLALSADGAVEMVYRDEESRERLIQSAAVVPAPAVDDAEMEEAAQPETTALPEETHGARPAPEQIADPLSDFTARTIDLDQAISSWGTAWHSVPLAELATKFAILKRVSQLTGHRIPDPAITRVSTVADLLATLTAPSKAKKLAQALTTDARLQALPNVAVFARRVTPIDLEKKVGRWKVIERELRARGLPVTGRA
ncbi:MAG: hypothetical protein M1832_004345 [Thelocarpon impressellum]|nr:MAG: hypothetical protein M1832_004345 [Thelocarpon impressellum]